MLVVLPFHAGDKAQAVTLANWIRELGQVSEDKCLIALGADTGEISVIEPLLDCFGSVSVFRAETKSTQPGAGPLGYWRASNAMWQAVAWKIHFQDKCPWLWLEPDAIPTRPTWLREIKQDYFEHGKPFMGFKSVKKAKVPGQPDQLWINGVAVYPASVCDYAPLALQAGEHAWDLNAGSQTVQHAHVSSLFQHVYLIEGQPPTFPKDKDKLNNAALFHRCKDGTLITFLKEHGYTKGGETHGTKEKIQEERQGRGQRLTPTAAPTVRSEGAADDSEEIGESVDYAQKLEEEQRRHPVRPQQPKEGDRFGELIWRGGKWHTAGASETPLPKADRKAVMERYKHPIRATDIPEVKEFLEKMDEDLNEENDLLQSKGVPETKVDSTTQNTENVSKSKQESVSQSKEDLPGAVLVAEPGLESTTARAEESAVGKTAGAERNSDSTGGQSDLLQSKGEGDIASIAHQGGPPEAKKEPEEPGSPSPQTRYDLIKEAVAMLKLLCTSPHAISKVRKELKKQKVTK